MTTWLDVTREAGAVPNGAPDEDATMSPAVIDARRRALRSLRDTATGDDARARFAAELAQLEKEQ